MIQQSQSIKSWNTGKIFNCGCSNKRFDFQIKGLKTKMSKEWRRTKGTKELLILGNKEIWTGVLLNKRTEFIIQNWKPHGNEKWFKMGEFYFPLISLLKREDKEKWVRWNDINFVILWLSFIYSSSNFYRMFSNFTSTTNLKNEKFEFSEKYTKFSHEKWNSKMK